MKELHKYLKEKGISIQVKIIIPTEMNKDNLNNCLKFLDYQFQSGNSSVTKEYVATLERCENNFEEEKMKFRTKGTFEEHLKKLELTVERRKKEELFKWDNY